MIADRWGILKNQIGEYLGAGDDILHLHGGMGLWLIAMLLLARGMTDRTPWLAVLAVEIANEMLDLSRPLGPENRLSQAAHDILYTMIGPTLFLLYARWRERGGTAPPEASGGDALQ